MDAEIKYTNPSPQYCREIVWSGDKERIFKRFYKENNSLKYCNGSHYTFKDANLEREYNMKPGKAYVINAAIPHGTINKSKESRVHIQTKPTHENLLKILNKEITL